MDCKKCKCAGEVVLRKKDYYCENCFINNVNHKFRACIGKNKILSANESVLICVSGGKGSTILLDLIYNGISMDTHKKLRVVPFFLHVAGYEKNSNDISELLIDQCRNYNFDIYIVHISEYYNPNSNLPDKNCFPSIKEGTSNKFDSMLNSMPTTTRNDFIKIIKRNLFIKFANQLRCKFVITAETSATLAINLLSNLSIGRGSQVQNDIGFCDDRDENVKILRPMREITNEEMDLYINIKNLTPICDNIIEANSLQKVIRGFVTDLQENFQSTISTVCKTADKIGIHDEEKCKKCLLCEGELSSRNNKLSALDATNFSRVVSFGKPALGQGEPVMSDNIPALNTVELTVRNYTPMFPYINDYLCYGCSRNYFEMGKDKLPEHIQTLLNK